MDRIIVYDKDRQYISLFEQYLQKNINSITTDIFDNIDDIRNALILHVDEYIFALIDIDDDHNQSKDVIELISTQYIPMLIITDKQYEVMRESFIRDYPVIDFVIKNREKNFHYMISIVQQMIDSQDIEVLLFCDNQEERDYIHDKLLRRYPFDIREAKSFNQAMDILRKYSKIKLLIIDLKEEESGLKLVELIRALYPKNQLSILVVTSRENTYLSAKYIHYGANDFAIKPINIETFHSRINVMIETITMLQKLEYVANVDYLTSLYNRRYFFDIGNMLFENARRKNLNICCAMLDIDYFKKINDTYGHAAGDAVLIQISKIIRERFRKSDLCARLGGEEFAIVIVNAEDHYIESIFESLRAQIEETFIQVPNYTINVTISIGVTTNLSKTFAETIDDADKKLYIAKQNGRNEIVF